MKVLVIVHGGGAWENYEDYLNFLRNTADMSPYVPALPEAKWKNHLKDAAFAQGWKVYAPAFPRKENTQYPEWQIFLGRIFEQIAPTDELVLVGHSLGGNMLIKYLAETRLDHVNIVGVHLVAACYNEGSFSSPSDAGWTQLATLASVTHIWQAKDDRVVPEENAHYIHGRIPQSHLHLFDEGEHFVKIPEFVELEKVVFGSV